MKKGRKTNKYKGFFWAIIILCGLVVAFVSPRHFGPSNAITVNVHPVPEEKPPAPPPTRSSDTLAKSSSEGGGEEPTNPEVAAPSAAPVIPVIPESEKPPVPGAKPRIAIVIDDVGMDMKGSERAIHLPPSITLSFLPYAPRLREQTKEARDEGHELLLHMPMEPIGHEDPGPGALLVDLPMRDLQQRFETALASFTGFDGVNNHMGSKFTAYPEGMSMVVAELQERHLFYLDSRTSAQSVGKKIAEEKGLPTIGRDVFLDDEQSPESIRVQLDETKRIAQHKGYAVAIGHPHASTMDVLEGWVNEASKQGYELVPLNNLITDK